MSRAVRWGVAGGLVVVLVVAWRQLAADYALLATVVLAVFIGVMLAPDIGALFAHFFVGGIMGDLDKFSRPPQAYSRARARAAEGRYEEAIAEYRRVLEQHPGDVTAQAEIADIYYEKLKDFARAVEEFNVLLGLKLDDSTRATTLMRLADLYEERFDSPQHAVECLSAIVQEYPDSKYAASAAERLRGRKGE
jgi:outer membrane protein assembly factor BamD (BamD/ComL family)